MRIYAISGHAQNGKDTVASEMYQILTQRGERVLQIHYADLLKFICSSCFGWDGKKDERGRHILQYVGTDVVRKKAPDYWVNFVCELLTIFDKEWDTVLIPDARFPNEIDRLKEQFHYVRHLRVIRPGFDNKLSAEQKKHPSETALDHVSPDRVFVNAGTLEDLKEQVAHYIEEKHH